MRVALINPMHWKFSHLAFVIVTTLFLGTGVVSPALAQTRIQDSNTALEKTTPSSSALTLQEAYQAALLVEDFKDQVQSLEGQSRARYNQAKSYLYPNLSAEGVYQDARYKEKATSLETETTRKTVGLNLRQPLFQGGLLSAIQKERAQMESALVGVQKAHLDLYAQVSESFYKIVLLESTLDVLKEIEVTSNKRVEEIRRRVQIGKSKQSDLLTNELQNQSLKLEMEQLRLSLENERQVFARMTGKSQEVSLLQKQSPKQLKPLEYYLNKISKTPEIEMQTRSALAAEKSVSMAKSQHLPNLFLDLKAKYGELRTHDKDREYLAQVTLNIPLFQGGRVSSESSEAQWKWTQEKAKLTALKKDTETLVRNQYQSLKTQKDLLGIYKKSLDLAKQNYDLFNKDLSLGLVSNVELLSSLNQYLESKKKYEDSIYQIRMAELLLNQIVGEFSE